MNLGDEILRIGAFAAAAAAIGAVLTYLYRRTGLRTAVRWLTRHVREDRAVERVHEFRAAFAHPDFKDDRLTEIRDVVDSTVTPQIQAIGARLTQHMDTEEESINEIKATVASHMEQDSLQFDAANSALSAGQTQLNSSLSEISGRLAHVESHLDKKPPSRRNP